MGPRGGRRDRGAAGRRLEHPARPRAGDRLSARALGRPPAARGRSGGHQPRVVDVGLEAVDPALERQQAPLGQRDLQRQHSLFALGARPRGPQAVAAGRDLGELGAALDQAALRAVAGRRAAAERPDSRSAPSLPAGPGGAGGRALLARGLNAGFMT